jgi:hypothetical protein
VRVRARKNKEEEEEGKKKITPAVDPQGFHSILLPSQHIG